MFYLINVVEIFINNHIIETFQIDLKINLNNKHQFLYYKLY